MDQFAGILFHMDLMDSHVFLTLLCLDLYLTIAADRQIQLGDLIVLRVIRIEIVLSVKFTISGDIAVCGKSYRHCVFQHLLIQYGKGSRHTGTDRTGVGIGCTTEGCGTSTENLGLRRQLYMHFQTDDGFILLFHVSSPPSLQMHLLLFHRYRRHGSDSFP